MRKFAAPLAVVVALAFFFLTLSIKKWPFQWPHDRTARPCVITKPTDGTCSQACGTNFAEPPKATSGDTRLCCPYHYNQLCSDPNNTNSNSVVGYYCLYQPPNQSRDCPH